MKDELMILTRLPRRLFCKLVARLEAIRADAAEDVEDYKDRQEENDYYHDKYVKALNTVRDVDMLLEALFEED